MNYRCDGSFNKEIYMSTIYHYTKGYNLFEILTSQEIKTEAVTGVRLQPSITNFAWFTAEERFPRTALPFVPKMPETNLQLHLGLKKPDVDMQKLAGHIGGVWRFKLNRAEFKYINSWIGSYSRQKLLKSPMGKINEIIAKNAGDNQALWFISSKPVCIAGMTLQQLTPQGWMDRAHFANQSGEVVVADIGNANISKIMTDSILQRIKMGLPVPKGLINS
jgi:hypothetical protein